MTPFKIILDIDSIRPPITGIGRYAYELAKGLSESPDVMDLRLLRRYRWVSDVDEFCMHEQKTSNNPLLRMPLLGSVQAVAMRTVGRIVTPAIKSWCTRHSKEYIYHSPNYALPPFSGRRVSTIHDLSVFRFPEYHPKERVQHMRRIFPKLLRRGDLFLTDSEFSRQEILSYTGLNEHKVVAIPLGVDARFKPMDSEDIYPILKQWRLKPNGYSLYVGTIEPRKNVERLIRVYRSLPAPLRAAFPLVLAGSEGWNSESIHKEIEDGQSEGWLVYLSYVLESDLPALYAGARLFAYVSLYEGFGLPLLEAMASGIPVLCSNATSLPEVGGDAVRYVDPLESQGIRQALIELLEDEHIGRRCRQRGLERAQEFTWTRTVRKTIEAYTRLL